MPEQEGLIEIKPALFRAAGGTIGQEVVEGVGKLSKANASAISTFKSGVVIDGFIFGCTLTYSAIQYQKGNIDEEQFRRIAVTRGTATAGSVCASSAGAFLGTMVFPGVGTFVGGVVGGIVGDFIGN